jgi:type II secretory pathway predicted ATPase ExeA
MQSLIDMYNSFFGFSTPPFENKLDQRFLFLGRDHGEVLAALLYFIQEKKGLAMVCGDVGTGKTMLLHGILGKLPASVRPIVISNPLVNYRELLSYVASTLGIPRREEILLELLDRIKETLNSACEQGETFVLIIDEAHLLSDDTLEHIRLLANIETPERKLLQILLVGQYELSHRLNLPRFRPLRQRINVNRFLSPLSAAETLYYVEHRLEKAGSAFDRCFAPGCKKLIWKLTAGVPRRINHLCDTALLICLSEGINQVNGKILQKAQDALQTDRIFTARYSSLPRVITFARQRKFIVPALTCLVLIGFWAMIGFSGFQGGSIFQKFLSGSVGSFQARVSPIEASPENSFTATATSVPAIAPSLAAPAVSSSSSPAVSPSPLAPVAQAQLASAKPEGIPAPPTSASSPTVDGKEPSALVAGDNSKLSRPTPEGQSSPAPTEPANNVVAATSSPAQTSRPRQVKVEDNDTLTRIAGCWFPGHRELGVVALLLANPQNLSANRIFVGQKLNLPLIDPDHKTIQVKEGLFYALWEEYPGIQALQKAVSELSRQNVRYTVMNDDTAKGTISYQVLIGAYGSREDLEQALSRLDEDSG